MATLSKIQKYIEDARKTEVEFCNPLDPIRKDDLFEKRLKFVELFRHNCDICGVCRIDEDIGVISYTLKNLAGATRNLKYCNDRESCHFGAIEKSLTQKM